MYDQMLEWRVLSDCIIEKVMEYIDEADAWESGTLLWTNGHTGDVVLGEKPQEEGYEGRDVTYFVLHDEDGDLVPDYDCIEDYASQWFDLRQA